MATRHTAAVRVRGRTRGYRTVCLSKVIQRVTFLELKHESVADKVTFWTSSVWQRVFSSENTNIGYSLQSSRHSSQRPFG